MNRNGIRVFAALSWLLAVIMLFPSCKKGEGYVNVLPKDAAVVISLDLKSMAQKIKSQPEVKEKALRKIGDALKGELNGSEELVDKVMRNPNECGLKLTDKVYFFVEAGAANAGFLARVSNDGKLERFIKELGKNIGNVSLKKEGGCTYVAIGSSIMAYTDTSFLVLAGLKGGRGEDLVHTVQMMLRQKEAESFASTSDFKNLREDTGDMACHFTLAALPSEYTSLMMVGMSSDINLSDVKAFVSASFENGKLAFKIENRTTDKTVLALQNKQQAAAMKLKGTFLSRFRANTLLWAGCGLNGKAYFELLKENPVVRQMFSSSMIPVDFDAIFSAVEGDVMFVMPQWVPSTFIVLAEVKDDAFLRTFEDLKSILAMTGGRMVLLDDGPKGYCFRSVDDSVIGTDELYFGVKDNFFYLTTDRQLIDERPAGLTVADTSWGKKALGKMGFFKIDFGALSGLVGAVLEKGQAGMPLLDCVSGEVEKANEAQVDVWLKDKEHNFLEQFVGLIP